jgi:hypothetical protein
MEESGISREGIRAAAVHLVHRSGMTDAEVGVLLSSAGIRVPFRANVDVRRRLQLAQSLRTADPGNTLSASSRAALRFPAAPVHGAPCLGDCTDSGVASFLDAVVGTAAPGMMEDAMLRQSLNSIVEKLPPDLPEAEAMSSCRSIGPLLPWIVSLLRADALDVATVELCSLIISLIAHGAEDKASLLSALASSFPVIGHYRSNVKVAENMLATLATLAQEVQNKVPVYWLPLAVW